MYEDKILVCKGCENEFTFTAGEQEFYAEKGFQEPKYCKECRQARKASKTGERKFYTSVCRECGGEAIVPFNPTSDKGVLCSACLEKARAAAAEE
ncbi:MAG: zinc-ribbon domain containing protein [Clostridia bacterium]|nr:zinc-ribbon domain containing protein [Clostridia bacterium]